MEAEIDVLRQALDKSTEQRRLLNQQSTEQKQTLNRDLEQAKSQSCSRTSHSVLNAIYTGHLVVLTDELDVFKARHGQIVQLSNTEIATLEGRL